MSCYKLAALQKARCSQAVTLSAEAQEAAAKLTTRSLGTHSSMLDVQCLDRPLSSRETEGLETCGLARSIKGNDSLDVAY